MIVICSKIAAQVQKHLRGSFLIGNYLLIYPAVDVSAAKLAVNLVLCSGKRRPAVIIIDSRTVTGIGLGIVLACFPLFSIRIMAITASVSLCTYGVAALSLYCHPGLTAESRFKRRKLKRMAAFSIGTVLFASLPLILWLM